MGRSPEAELDVCRTHTPTRPPIFFELINHMDIKAAKAKLTPPPTLDEKLKDVSKMYEQQFLQEMMRAMRSTVDHSEFSKPSMAEKIYKDQLFDQYAESWVKNGGNGLADMIYRELKDKILPSQHNRYLPKSPNGSPADPTAAKSFPVHPEEAKAFPVHQVEITKKDLK